MRGFRNQTESSLLYWEQLESDDEEKKGSGTNWKSIAETALNWLTINRVLSAT